MSMDRRDLHFLDFPSLERQDTNTRHMSKEGRQREWLHGTPWIQSFPLLAMHAPSAKVWIEFHVYGCWCWCACMCVLLQVLIKVVSSATCLAVPVAKLASCC